MKEEKMSIVTSDERVPSVQNNEFQSVEGIIIKAIEQNVPVETMERLLSMRKELKAERAKEMFDKAMSGFQSECPIIKRIKDGSKTKSGITAFKYAPLEAIIKQVQPLLRKYQLSYTFKPIKNEHGKLTDVRCYATHIDGYSEYSEMPVNDGGGTQLMTGAQISAANITFSKRYAFCNIFGIVTEEEDNEDNLLDDDSYESEVAKAKVAIDQCKTEEELKSVWNSFPKAIKGNKEVIVFVNQIKANIQNENSHDGAKK